MQKNVLTYLFLLSAMSLFGATLERDNIMITYEKCLKYHTTAFGLPYCLTVTNHAQYPLTISPKLIDAPLRDYRSIIKAVRNEYKLAALMTTLLSAGAGSLAYAMFKNMKDRQYLYNRSVGAELSGKKVCINVASAIGAAAMTTYLLYGLLTETEKILEKKLAQEVLHEAVTIQPGRSVRKIFWLTDQDGPVRINFDSVEGISLREDV